MVAPGVAAYLASTQRELQTLVDTFPKAWRRINSQDFRALLRSALVP
jgi:hypothetical protein